VCVLDHALPVHGSSPKLRDSHYLCLHFHSNHL